MLTMIFAGLDQNMMQKNLTCKSLGEAQKNIIVMTVIYLTVTFVFLVLGVLLYIYIWKKWE